MAMMISRYFPASTLACGAALAFSAFPVLADDIDIYTNASAGGANEPVVMFLLDNTPNWSKNDQKITDLSNTTFVASGVAETQAIIDSLNVITSASHKPPLAAGVAMFTDSGLNDAAGNSIGSGGYIRFGARDITATSSASTNYTALSTLLGWYAGNSSNNINTNTEKLGGQPKKNESAALYEMYKYFKGLAPYAGTQSPAKNSSPPNQFVDINSNSDSVNTSGFGGYTTFGLNLTSGFAIQNGLYNSPLGSGCTKGYVIYIANNANYNFQTNASQFETGGASALPALPATVDDSWADEWARVLNQNGIVVFVIDTFNANQDTSYSTSLQAIASAGGGKYFQAKSQGDLEKYLGQILGEILSVNSTFASASLPVNTTNRSQDLNQVFIGSFRPDPDLKPRWKGNLKQYQIIKNGSIALGDFYKNNAINSTTGYIQDCAVSFWTADTSLVSPPSTAEAYWLSVPDDSAANSQNKVTQSQCTKPNPSTPSNPSLPSGTSLSPYSDWPDGPTVEKGGVAQVLREGNTAAASSEASQTFTVNRSILTQGSGSALTAVTTTNSNLTSTVLSWVQGNDNNAIPDKPGNATTAPYNTRPFIHGDVVHSQPQAINYGTQTVVYYGANDGMYRAVDSSNGTELWAFIAPEFFTAANSVNNANKFTRLYNNSPLISTPYTSSSTGDVPKDYFFDGNTGAYQNSDNSNVWIYPTMRRGGRLVYALDVTSSSSPKFKWKFGCPDAADDTGCTTGSSAIGQTWSTPIVVFVDGYSTTTPVVIVGGGYDTCEDANSATPSCGSAKGAVVYVLDADTGALIQSFTATGMRSIAGDPSVASLHADGSVDYAYFADTGGSIYRLDFSDTSGTAWDKTSWKFHKIAYTSGSYRKFLYGPAVLPIGSSSSPQAAYVAIGSGDREHPLSIQYPYTTPVINRFYVLLDDLTTSSRAVVNLDDTTTTDTFYMGDYTGNTCSGSACDSFSVYPNSSTSQPLKVGWFVNLNKDTSGNTVTGTQVVTSPLIVAGGVSFSTNRPLPSSNSCTSSLGEADGCALNLFNGSGATSGGGRCVIFPGGGLPASPVLFTTTVTDSSGSSSGGTSGSVTGTIGTPDCKSALQACQPNVSVNSKRRVVYWHSSGDNK
jgi:type IV pilus assembly protein PilY1